MRVWSRGNWLGRIAAVLQFRRSFVAVSFLSRCSFLAAFYGSGAAPSLPALFAKARLGGISTFGP
ncbi:hypothetical protein COO20_02915 [Thalassospira marina]|uniref:Uncharacterized protein n=2 Tax=Thalassospira marina TaxID=2048283 RepID=A0A2N3L019_9PROT|nr:hypothetical protein COO20_02915 [Thalassospira marina]